MAVQSKAIIQAFASAHLRLRTIRDVRRAGARAFGAQRYPRTSTQSLQVRRYTTRHLNESRCRCRWKCWKDPTRLVPAAKGDPVQQRCTGGLRRKDGVKDGIVSDPRTCKFDPAVLLCKSGMPPIVSRLLRWIPQRRLCVGHDKIRRAGLSGHSPGFEFGWRIPTTAAARILCCGHAALSGPSEGKFRFDVVRPGYRSGAGVEERAVIESSDPNLAKFKARGGKLLMYHGWADPGPAPENTINYYSAVTKALGGAKQDD